MSVGMKKVEFVVVVVVVVVVGRKQKRNSLCGYGGSKRLGWGVRCHIWRGKGLWGWSWGSELGSILYVACLPQ